MKLLKQLNLIIFLLSFCYYIPALSFEFDLNTQKTKSLLTLSGDMTQIKIKKGTISGTGVKIDFTNYLNSSLATELYLSSALNSTGSSNITTLGGYVYYVLLGDCCKSKKTITVDGSTALTELTPQKRTLLIGAGVDQIFLNGNKAVYSISGIGIGVAYYFSLFNYTFKASSRFSTMKAAGSSAQGLFLNLGMAFDL